MSNSICFSPVCSLAPSTKPGVFIRASNAGKVLQVHQILQRSTNSKFQTLEAKAAGGNRGTKPNSIVCANCDGNGAIACSQCKGSGVNSVDHFNGQFKAGGLCWLCRGKKETLCGDCNGAGFVGGFMSTFDD
ncbi:hypothetical protein Tsubulata_013877 [Turnera subulata]|uniref:BSD2 cysteine rich domain-containing protein n=1 Tax=Turnera subulata TaxID=218843 RepID=A0A9Q0FWL3_9ROSI|nr:hypothetical protein Tsubulata_013877 [Turnera subulata]